MFYLNKTLKNELNSIISEIYTIKNKLEEHTEANNTVIRDAKKDFEKLETKTTYLQKEIANLKKEKELLLNGLNETRLAVKQIATILYNKGFIKLKEENKNERNNTKRKHSKQNISKHC